MQRTKIFQLFNRRWLTGMGSVILIGLVAWLLLWGGAGASAGTEGASG
jgi:hypothetical protein